MKEDELPPGWAWATLGDVVEVLDHKRVPVSAKVRATRPGKVPYYGATGQVGWIDESIFDEELVLLGEDGVQFFNRQGQKAYLVHGPSWVNNHAHVLRSIDGLISAKYLMHYLNVFNYEGYANGTTRLKLTKSAMLGIPIPLSPRVEQERIVDALEDHLSRLDVAQTSLESGRLRMLALERSISESMRSKCSGSPVRELGELFREPLRNGHSARAATGSDGGIRTLTLTAVTKNEFSDRYTKLTDADPGKVSNLWLEPGDILIQRSNTPDLVGTSAIYDGPENWAIYPDLLIRVRMNDEVIPSFVALMLSSPSVRRYFKSRAKGLAGSMPKIDQSTIAKVRMPVPSIECQQEILFESRELLEQLDRTSRDLRTAQRRGSALRSAMLRTAFGGKLVSQEPADEPALTLLERIKAERASQPKPTRKRSAKTATASTRPAPATSSDPAGTYVQEELGL